MQEQLETPPIIEITIDTEICLTLAERQMLEYRHKVVHNRSAAGEFNQAKWWH